MIEAGRICTKIAGREAGKVCVIVNIIDKNYCLIDGQVRRKKCNNTHLDPLDRKIDIEKGASHEKVVSEFQKFGLEITEPVKKEKKPQQKQETKANQEDKKEKIKKAKKDTRK